MAVPIKKLSVSLIRRNAIKRGPTSSDAWNDSFEEAVNDLSRFVSQWNESLHPLLSRLPDGTNDLNAFTNGLDGRTLYVDLTATNVVSDTTFFNTVSNRPNSVKDQFSAVYTKITQLQQDLETQIANAGGTLTDAQKNRIGANIFDSTAPLFSPSTSLDGKSENNRLNLIQVARDVYGPAFTLDNNGAANLTNSVMAMVDALLELHNGNWDNDIALSHAGAIDTSTFVLRDGSNSMTGSLKLADGTALAPGLTFAADLDTGLYRPGINQLGFVAGGGLELAKFDGATGALHIDKIRPNFLSGIDIDLITPADGALNIIGSIITSLLIQTNTAFRQLSGYQGSTADGPTAIAHLFDTLVAYTNPGSKLLSLRNAGIEKLYADKDGGLFLDNLFERTSSGLIVNAPVGGIIVNSSTTLKAQGPFASTNRITSNVITVTTAGTYIVLPSDHYIIINKTVAVANQVNLPVGAELGRIIKVKDGKGDAGTNNITVSGNGSNIDGGPTFVLNANYQGVEFVWNGSEWSIF